MNNARYIFIGLIALVVGLVAILYAQLFDPKSKTGKLTMFCAAGMRLPMQKVVAQYEEEYGVKVDVQYEGSGTLFGKMAAGAPFDIFLAADSGYTNDARAKGLVEESMPVCFLTAGIAVTKGNPKGIATLNDLLRADVKVGIGNPELASVGKFTRKVLKKVGIWDELEPKLTVKKPTVNDLANTINVWR